MTIERRNRPVSAKRIATISTDLLDAASMCAIATVSRHAGAYVNTAYFAWGDDLRCVWLSHPSAAHSENIRSNPSIAIAVYDSTQTWGKPDRGIQLFGKAKQARGRDERDALALYGRRFPAYAQDDLSSYRFYMFRPTRIKLFDEHVLGAGLFVTAAIRDGRVAWERTERYVADA